MPNITELDPVAIRHPAPSAKLRQILLAIAADCSARGLLAENADLDLIARRLALRTPDQQGRLRPWPRKGCVIATHREVSA